MYAFLSVWPGRSVPMALPELHRAHAILIAVALAIGVAGCGGASSATDATESSGTTNPIPTNSETAGAAPAKADFATIFPPGPGRDLVLENCQSCHLLTPIIVLQMEKDAWHRNSLDHRPRVSALTDEEFRTVYEYLPKHFGPHRPVPELPQAMLDEWTSY